jgi:hypothetical protein
MSGGSAGAEEPHSTSAAYECAPERSIKTASWSRRLVQAVGLEPTLLSEPDFESGAFVSNGLFYMVFLSRFSPYV